MPHRADLQRARGDPFPMSPPTDDYLAPSDAARLLRVAPRTILRWLREGRIPYELSSEGEPRLRRQDVIRLMDPPDEPGGDQE